MNTEIMNVALFLVCTVNRLWFQLQTSLTSSFLSGWFVIPTFSSFKRLVIKTNDSHSEQKVRNTLRRERLFAYVGSISLYTSWMRDTMSVPIVLPSLFHLRRYYKWLHPAKSFLSTHHSSFFLHKEGLLILESLHPPLYFPALLLSSVWSTLQTSPSHHSS